MTKRRRTPDVESRWAAKGKEGEVEEVVEWVKEVYGRERNEG
jgi:hypothetical protein